MSPESEVEKPVDEELKRHFGVVTSVEGDQLRTTDDSGVEHVHTVAPHAEVIGRGKHDKVSDLAIGSRVLVSEGEHDTSLATGVESLRKPGSASD